MQAEKGDNATERPMWAEKGGLDFDGRAKWDAWAAVKGAKPDKAKLSFVKVGHLLHADAEHRRRNVSLVCNAFTFGREVNTKRWQVLEV